MNSQEDQPTLEQQIQEKRNIGDSFYENREYLKALEAYDETLAMNPDNAAVRNDKGRVHYMRNEYQDALKCFRQALETDSTPERVKRYHYNIGCTLEMILQYEEALQAYNQALLIHPLYEKAVYRKMLLLTLDLKRDEELVQFCNEVLSLDSGNEEALTEKAIALTRLRRYDEAIRAYDEALKHYPQSKSKRYSSTYVLHNKNMLLRAMQGK